MTKLYSTQTGQPVDVPEEQAVTALQSGKFGLPAGATLPVEGEDGISQVPVEQLGQALASGGQVTSKEAFDSQELQKAYGGVKGQVIAGAEGAASGATLGLTDDLAAALGGNKVREHIENYRKANPYSAAAGQILGAIAPAVLTGGESAIAEGGELASTIGKAADVIGAPSRGIARAGGAVEDFVAGLLDAKSTDSFATSLAKQVAAKGAGAATEGAAVGAAQHITEEALGDPNANGESLLAAVGHGALLGFGVGGALGAGGEIGNAVLGRLAPHVGRLAETQAVRAISPGAVRELEQIPGGVRAAGRRLLDDGVIELGDTSEQLAPKVAKAAKDADARLVDILDTADKAGIRGPAVEEMFAKAAKHPEATRALEAITGIPSVEEAAARGLDRDAMMFGAKLSFRDALNLSTAPVARGVFDSEIASASDRAMRQLGGAAEASYKEAKLAVEQYAAIGQALQKAKPTATDILGGTAAAVGLLTHGLSGGIGGLALSLAKRAAAERGSSTAAVLLDKVAALHGVERAVKSVDRQIARGVSGIVPSGAERAAVKAKTVEHAVGKEAYAERVAAVQRAAADPKYSAQMASADISEHAPATAKAFESSAVRATQYLASMIPQSRRMPSITPQFDRPHVANAMEKASFNRAFDVAHDPMVVLQAARDGRLTKDHVKAMAAIYPALYARVVQQAQEKLSDLKHPLTTSQKQQLDTLLQRTPNADVARRYQQTYAMEAPKPPNPQQQQHANKAPKRPITAPARNTALDVGRPVGS